MDLTDIAEKALRRNPPPSEWRTLHRNIIENSLMVQSTAPKEAQIAEAYGQHIVILRAFLDEAQKTCIGQGHGPESREAHVLMDQAVHLAQNLTNPSVGFYDFRDLDPAKITEKQVLDAFRVTSDVQRIDLDFRASKGWKLGLDVPSFERGVGGYLNSQFRIPAIDRLIVAALIDSEVTAYMREMMVKDFFSKKTLFQQQGLHLHPMWTYLIGRLLAGGLGALVLGGIYYANSFGWFGVEVALLLGAATVLLFIIGTLVTFVSLVRAVGQWRKRRAEFWVLPRAMAEFYGEFRTSGPLSVRRIRERATELDEQGAVWSPSLWAILDDVEARGVIVLND